MSPEQFEAVVRRALRERDSRRRARLGDPNVYALADQEAVTAIMGAAGYGEPDPARPVRKAARRTRANEDRAFAGGGE
jgi:hypothetical protein